MRACLLFGCWILLPATAVLADPSAAPAEESEPVHHYFLKEPATHAAPWGYKGKTGPAFWGKLSPKYRMAEEGRRQSPIDIDLAAAQQEDLPELLFAYRPETIAARNNGHTIEHDSEDSGSQLQVGGVVYRLEQFHVHAPSEHTINGEHAPLEIHFVHKSAAGEVAVVAVLVQPGERNTIEIPPSTLPSKKDELVVAYRGVRNPADFLPADRTYLTYSGSFTTPPCTEDVRWFVLRKPSMARPGLIDRMSAILQGNNRPVQPLNGRRVDVEKP